MTAINLKNLIEIAQRKIAVVDSNSSTRDLENLMEITMLTGGGHKADSAGFDSDVSNYVGRVVFIDSGSEGFFKFNQTIAGAPSATPNQNFTQIAKGGTYTSNPSPGSGPVFTVASINGSSYGFRGFGGFPAPYASNVIDKYSYSSDGNATDVGDLLGTRTMSISSSTATHGFSLGSYPVGVAEKYSHTSDGNSTAITALNTPAYFGTGNTSDTNHYITQHYGTAVPGFGPSYNTGVVKAPIASEDAYSDTGVDWSATTGSNASGMSAQSYTHGYVLAVGAGFPNAQTGSNKIEKFPFAAEDASSDVGDLTKVRGQKTDNSYLNVYGFSSGGNNPNSPSPTTVLNEIERISFASDGNGTDIADLSQARVHGAGTNSPTHGYMHGGSTGAGPNPGPGHVNTIDKFPFTSGSNSTDVGDLTSTAMYGGGTQV